MQLQPDNIHGPVARDRFLRSLVAVSFILSYGPRQANLLLIAYASSEGSGKPAHQAVSYKQ